MPTFFIKTHNRIKIAFVLIPTFFVSLFLFKNMNEIYSFLLIIITNSIIIKIAYHLCSKTIKIEIKEESNTKECSLLISLNRLKQEEFLLSDIERFDICNSSIFEKFTIVKKNGSIINFNCLKSFVLYYPKDFDNFLEFFNNKIEVYNKNQTNNLLKIYKPPYINDRFAFKHFFHKIK